MNNTQVNITAANQNSSSRSVSFFSHFVDSVLYTNNFFVFLYKNNFLENMLEDKNIVQYLSERTTAPESAGFSNRDVQNKKGMDAIYPLIDKIKSSLNEIRVDFYITPLWNSGAKTFKYNISSLSTSYIIENAAISPAKSVIIHHNPFYQPTIAFEDIEELFFSSNMTEFDLSRPVFNIKNFNKLIKIKNQSSNQYSTAKVTLFKNFYNKLNLYNSNNNSFFQENTSQYSSTIGIAFMSKEYFDTLYIAQSTPAEDLDPMLPNDSSESGDMIKKYFYVVRKQDNRNSYNSIKKIIEPGHSKGFVFNYTSLQYFSLFEKNNNAPATEQKTRFNVRTSSTNVFDLKFSISRNSYEKSNKRSDYQTEYGVKILSDKEDLAKNYNPERKLFKKYFGKTDKVSRKNAVVNSIKNNLKNNPLEKLIDISEGDNNITIKIKYFILQIYGNSRVDGYILPKLNFIEEKCKDIPVYLGTPKFAIKTLLGVKEFSENETKQIGEEDLIATFKNSITSDPSTKEFLESLSLNLQESEYIITHEEIYNCCTQINKKFYIITGQPEEILFGDFYKNYDKKIILQEARHQVLEDIEAGSFNEIPNPVAITDITLFGTSGSVTQRQANISQNASLSIQRPSKITDSFKSQLALLGSPKEATAQLAEAPDKNIVLRVLTHEDSKINSQKQKNLKKLKILKDVSKGLVPEQITLKQKNQPKPANSRTSAPAIPLETTTVEPPVTRPTEPASVKQVENLGLGSALSQEAIESNEALRGLFDTSSFNKKLSEASTRDDSSESKSRLKATQSTPDEQPIMPKPNRATRKRIQEERKKVKSNIKIKENPSEYVIKRSGTAGEDSEKYQSEVKIKDVKGKMQTFTIWSHSSSSSNTNGYIAIYCHKTNGQVMDNWGKIDYYGSKTKNNIKNYNSHRFQVSHYKSLEKLANFSKVHIARIMYHMLIFIDQMEVKSNFDAALSHTERPEITNLVETHHKVWQPNKNKTPLTERSAKGRNQIKKYYYAVNRAGYNRKKEGTKVGGLDYNRHIAEKKAWSAVYISWQMQQLDKNKINSKTFPKWGGHSHYTAEGIYNRLFRLPNQETSYASFALKTDSVLKLGDVLYKSRKGGKKENSSTTSHGDIIYKFVEVVNPKKTTEKIYYALLSGGNTSHGTNKIDDDFRKYNTQGTKKRFRVKKVGNDYKPFVINPDGKDYIIAVRYYSKK